MVISSLGSNCLLVAHGHTGNNVFCTPAIKFLKQHFPDTNFDIVALNKKSAEVFSENPFLHKVFTKRFRWQIKSQSQYYDTVICLNYKSKHLMEDIYKPKFIVSQVPAGKHHADHILEEVAKYTGKNVFNSDRHYYINSSKRSLSSIMNDQEFITDNILIGMHLGCARTAIHGWKSFFTKEISHRKLWPIEKYIALAKELQLKNRHIKFFITGTRNEKFLGESFEKAISGTINLMGKTHLTDLPVVLNNAHAFITQDCGVMHAACSTSVPLVALFGPTCWKNSGPYPQTKTRVVIAKDSMEDITPAEVAKVTLSVMNSTKSVCIIPPSNSYPYSLTA